MLGAIARRGAGTSARRAFHTSAPLNRIYDSILDTVGDTPVVKINKMGPKDVTVYGAILACSHDAVRPRSLTRAMVLQPSASTSIH